MNGRINLFMIYFTMHKFGYLFKYNFDGLCLRSDIKLHAGDNILCLKLTCRLDCRHLKAIYDVQSNRQHHCCNTQVTHPEREKTCSGHKTQHKSEAMILWIGKPLTVSGVASILYPLS